MKPRVKDNDIEIMVIRPLSSIKTKNLKVDGKTMKDADGKSIKETKQEFIKETFLKTWMDRRDIASRGEYIGSNGKKLTTRSEIYNKATNQFYTVAHSIQELNEAIHFDQKIPVGFKPLNRNNEI